MNIKAPAKVVENIKAVARARARGRGREREQKRKCEHIGQSKNKAHSRSGKNKREQ